MAVNVGQMHCHLHQPIKHDINCAYFHAHSMFSPNVVCDKDTCYSPHTDSQPIPQQSPHQIVCKVEVNKSSDESSTKSYSDKMKLDFSNKSSDESSTMSYCGDSSRAKTPPGSSGWDSTTSSVCSSPCSVSSISDFHSMNPLL